MLYIFFTVVKISDCMFAVPLGRRIAHQNSTVEPLNADPLRCGAIVYPATHLRS